MSEESDVLGAELEPETDASGETAESQAPPEEREPMPPVESRFMFVDIAALRAKQLRRGALPRISLPSHEVESAAMEPAQPAPKLERIAMQEVEEGLIVYDFQGTDSADEKVAAEETS